MCVHRALGLSGVWEGGSGAGSRHPLSLEQFLCNVLVDIGVALVLGSL